MKILAPVMAAVTLALSIFAFPATAAAPAHFWSRHYGGMEGDAVSSIAIHPASGDVVATGFFFQTINFGTGDLVVDTPTNGTTDIWIARFNRKGEVKWAKRFGDGSSDAGSGVAVDAAGNIYWIGRFEGFIDLGGGNLNSIGNGDIAIAKFDPNGTHIWSHGYGSGGYDAPSAIALDASGNVVVTGLFDGTINLGGPSVASTGGSDVFFAKYNSSGVFQWQVTGGNSADAGIGVSTDAAGNVYGTGYFSAALTFAPLTTLNSVGGIDMYLVKINAAGVPQWSIRQGTSGNEFGFSISADAAGNFAVTGAFTGTGNVGGSNMVATGIYDGFLAKYNNLGAHQWSFKFGGAADYEAGYGVFLNPSGKVFLVAGSTNDIGGAPGSGLADILTAKFSSTGVVTWSKLAGGPGDDRGATIAVDTGDNVVVGGAFEEAVNFGGGPLESNGRTDIVLARYGVGEPAISSIVDVGNDQGRNVRITLTRSLLDDGTADLPIVEYQAFRRILPLPSYLLARGNGPLAAPPGMWEHVASIPAGNSSTYRMVAPTLADSTVTEGMYRTKFYVRAATANPSLFFDSPVDSGYSLDNLAPGVPTNFSYSSGELNWDKSKSGDFDFFSVYGANTNSFASATLIDYAVDPTLDVTASPYTYFFVTATDFSGNEGKFAVASAASAVGGTPGHYVLSVSAYPNPFNPQTTIRYTLPARGHVQLDVFDLRGERVATLVDREHAAGAFTASWNGRNAAGESVGSGVYFARLKTRDGERAYKLVLLK